jgi:hypothetical protein
MSKKLRRHDTPMSCLRSCANVRYPVCKPHPRSSRRRGVGEYERLQRIGPAARKGENAMSALNAEMGWESPAARNSWPGQPAMGWEIFCGPPLWPSGKTSSLKIQRSRVRCVGLVNLPPSVGRLSTQCGVLNISQPYRPPWPVTGIDFLIKMIRG